MDKEKQLVILGNGFDLSCGLKSTYNDFFEWRLNRLFGTTDADSIIEKLNKADLNNLIKDPKKINFTGKTAFSNLSTTPLANICGSGIGHKETQKENNLPQFCDIEATFPEITRWDIFFIYAQKYLQDGETNEWQDVENIIDNVLAVALHDREENEIISVSKPGYTMNLNFKNGGEEQFKDIIYKYACMDFDKTDKESIAHILLIQLIYFEEKFSQYIYSQMDVDKSQNFESDYFRNAKELLKEITNDSNKKESELNVWSFNYTLGPRFQKKLNDEGWDISAWNNIHGLSCCDDPNASWIARPYDKIPAPIFGIDPEDDLSFRGYRPSARVIFTKPYRIINNKFKNIRQGFKFRDFDKIIIYGHSLGKADYSYFKYIFDETNVYDSSVELIFYYWPGSCEQDLVEKQLNERKYTETVVKLLNLYGVDSNAARDDIVTKLAIEGRLTILPDPSIAYDNKMDRK